jgi:AraC-like DNA-binding protein
MMMVYEIRHSNGRSSSNRTRDAFGDIAWLGYGLPEYVISDSNVTLYAVHSGMLRLADPIALKDMAASAGVTRMHFAAQFRLAVGSPPHEYLMRRRIERAKSHLLNADKSILDVALACGSLARPLRRSFQAPCRCFAERMAGGKNKAGDAQLRPARSSRSAQRNRRIRRNTGG